MTDLPKSGAQGNINADFNTISDALVRMHEDNTPEAKQAMDLIAAIQRILLKNRQDIDSMQELWNNADVLYLDAINRTRPVLDKGDNDG